MNLKEELPPKIKSLVGNTLLGQNPAIAKLQRRKPEPDTEWEEDLYNDLEDWTGESTDYIAQHFLKNKNTFKKLASEYPTIMQPPHGKLAYRGTIVKAKSIINAIETRSFKVVKIKDAYYIQFSKFPYTPKRPAQSWTVDPKVATNFGSGASTFNKTAQVLYSTPVDDSFVFNPKLMAVVFGGQNESEVVRLGRRGEFDALITARWLSSNHLLPRLKGLRAYFEKARVLWNTKHAPKLAKKSTEYSLEDLIIPSWSSLREVEGYRGGIGPVGFYYKKLVSKALKTLAKR